MNTSDTGWVMDDLKSAPSKGVSSGWRAVGWLAIVSLFMVLALHVQFFVSTEGEMLRSLKSTYVSDTDFFYEIGTDKVTAVGQIKRPDDRPGSLEAYQLEYRMADFESATELARAFANDKRRLRSGETATVVGSLTSGTANRELKSSETLVLYGLMPGMFFSALPIMMGSFGLAMLALFHAQRATKSRNIVMGAALIMGLSVPSLKHEFMIAPHEPYVLVEQKNTDVSAGPGNYAPE